jgi:hypothetical protein
MNAPKNRALVTEKQMIQTESFDAAQYLTAPEDQVDLLNEALASGDAKVVTHALGIIVRARGMTSMEGDESNLRLSEFLGLLRDLGMTLIAQSEAWA